MRYLHFLSIIFLLTAGCSYHLNTVCPEPQPLLSACQPQAQRFFTASILDANPALPASAGGERENNFCPLPTGRADGSFRSAAARTMDSAAARKTQAGEENGNDFNDDGLDDFDETNGPDEDREIADPLEGFNRAMFQFNDKLYFWILKPAAEGYQKVVPQTARTSVSRLFDNARFPIRFINNLLQLNIEGALTELGRFTVNTLWGIGGLLDPASREEVGIGRSDADLGQTLGIYGVGPGLYVVWPVLGPSSVRDSVRIVGEYFLDPVSYVNPLYASFGVRAYDTVNDTSLRIGDYEALKDAAIDPYVALRDAYFQYREGKIRKTDAGTEPPKPGGVK
jgi:phospholipid-binding lipoprotein MlaA